MIRTALVGLGFAAVAGLLSAAARPEPAPMPRGVSAAPADALEFVAVGDEKLTRIGVRVDVDGRPLSAVWADTFDKLFAYHDRNGDGHLDEKEAASLPSPFAVRQLLWGQFAPYSGPSVPWKEFDRDGDAKVTKAELADYYRRHGLGTVQVGVGRPQATAALTAALLKAVDANGDGTVIEAEWKAAADTLRKIDRNDDELIGPGELVPKTAYPGAIGAVLLTPPAEGERTAPELDRLPLLLLPADRADTHWATVVVARRDADKDGRLDAKEAGLAADVFAGLDADRDGKLTPAELAVWRTAAPAAGYAVHLGKRPTDRQLVEGRAGFASNRLWLEVCGDEGKMPGMAASARKRFLDRFQDADADADGFVVAGEVTKRTQYELQQLLTSGDRNGDGRLSKAELEGWVDLQDRVAAGLVLLTVLDHGAGLFELLDADHDGSLSVPELRRAWDRVKAAGCIRSDGAFDSTALPRQLILTASRGHPINALGSAPRGGPGWFRAMDRNGDGYVSRREFTGPADVFDRLDLDKDGLLSPEEAGKAAPPVR